MPILESAALPEIDDTELAMILRKAVDSPAAELIGYRIEPLSGGMGQATRGVYRLSCTTRNLGRRVPWTVVLKVITLDMQAGHSFLQDEAHPLYWKREALAYKSGLLDVLPGGIGAPRCYGISEKEAGTVWLWLEHLQDGDGGGWSVEGYWRAACALGRFNGAYLTGRPLPSYPWIVRSGSPRGLLDHNLWIRDLVANPDTWRNPLIRAVFPVPVAEPLLRLWDDSGKLLALLDRVPETFCHLDAWRANMFAPANPAGGPNLFLIDWAYPGRSAVGTDAGDLFGESFSLAELGDVAPHLLDEAVFEGYITGLRDAGWGGDANVVRFAFTAFCSLKHLCFLAWLADVDDESKQTRWEHLFKRPFIDFAAREAEFVYYLLHLANEARGLSAHVATRA